MWVIIFVDDIPVAVGFFDSIWLIIAKVLPGEFHDDLILMQWLIVVNWSRFLSSSNVIIGGLLRDFEKISHDLWLKCLFNDNCQIVKNIKKSTLLKF